MTDKEKESNFYFKNLPVSYNGRGREDRTPIFRVKAEHNKPLYDSPRIKNMKRRSFIKSILSFPLFSLLPRFVFQPRPVFTVNRKGRLPKGYLRCDGREIKVINSIQLFDISIVSR